MVCNSQSVLKQQVQMELEIYYDPWNQRIDRSYLRSTYSKWEIKSVLLQDYSCWTLIIVKLYWSHWLFCFLCRKFLKNYIKRVVLTMNLMQIVDTVNVLVLVLTSFLLNIFSTGKFHPFISCLTRDLQPDSVCFPVILVGFWHWTGLCFRLIEWTWQRTLVVRVLKCVTLQGPNAIYYVCILSLFGCCQPLDLGQ